MRSYRIHIGLVSALLAATLAAPSAHAADGQARMAALIERGQYLATASDCVACHTAPKGKPYAGGLAIGTPLGAIYSSNISPSFRYGIGGYTEDEFARALRRGIRKDGANLYPAMPYTAYARLSDDDMSALYAYFMHGVQPVDAPAPATRLPFPMNIRASMKVWNFLFLDTQPYVPDPHQSTQWNRGAYLVLGAAHCGTCHTPRGLLMQEDTHRQLAGGQTGPWFAPNITSDAVSGIGSWTKEELVQYLQTGHLPGKAGAAGSMGEAVEHSFQYLDKPDLDAIATYVKSAAPVAGPAEHGSRFGIGKMSTVLGTLRGTSGVRSDNGPDPRAADLFQGSCASCHSAHGEGSKDGYYPSLFHNSATGAHNPNNLVATILFGVDRTTAQGQAFMPGFGGNPTDPMRFNDREIALLTNYVLQQYGRAGAPVTEEAVAQVRRGGPTSNLVTVARVGIAAALCALLLAIALVLRCRRRGRRT